MPNKFYNYDFEYDNQLASISDKDLNEALDEIEERIELEERKW